MNIKLIVTVVLLALFITACGGSTQTSQEPTPDVAAVRTSAAGTVVSQFTLTAAAFTPVPSLPTDTSAPEVSTSATASQPPLAQITNAQGTTVALCDILSYDVSTVDVNIPDNTIMTPGQDFIKTWKVKNNGSCPWGAGYVLAYANYDDQMSGQFIAFTEVIQPGQEVEVSVQFKAPTQADTYVSAWSMRNPAGVFFPETIFVKIIVQ